MKVDGAVLQKVQQLPGFLSDSDGWPLKSKVLTWFDYETRAEFANGSIFLRPVF